jgi:tRNA A-37 threonylcarbamoyl transferase component Bud32
MSLVSDVSIVLEKPPAPEDPGTTVEIHPEAARILKLAPEGISGFIHIALQEHHRLLAAHSGLVRKNAPESAVTVVYLPGMPKVCVKEIRWRGYGHGLKSLFRPTQGLRTYRNGRRLNDVGFSAAMPLALIRKRRLGLIRTEWIVMEVVQDSLELDRYLVHRIKHNWSAEERKGMARLLGRFIGSMHAGGICHSDLKTCNIVVSEDNPTADDISESGHWRPLNPCRPIRFSLLDYDDVSFSREVSNRKRIKNLVQIFLSMPSAINAGDRMRFLNEYALHVGLTGSQKRQIAQQVVKAAKGRDILYVGFDGDIVESWSRTEDT